MFIMNVTPGAKHPLTYRAHEMKSGCKQLE